MEKELLPTEEPGTNMPDKIQETLPTTMSKPFELSTMDSMIKAVEGSKELGDVEKLKVGTINLKSEYLSFEEIGKPIRRVFLGFSMRMSVDPGTGEEKGLVPAAQLYDPSTETVNICMQTVLVGVLVELGYPKGAAIQITYKGDKKGKSGLKYQDFDIRALIPENK